MERMKKERGQNPRKILEDFSSVERWRKADSMLSQKKRGTAEKIQDRNFLIERYKSKFPEVTGHVIKGRDIVRL